MKKYLLALMITLCTSWAWAAGGWAAIAYDSTNGNYGYSYGWYNKQQAESTAISYCGSLNCKAVASVHNGWVALAVSKNTVATWGAGYAADRYQALYWAMYYCNQGTYACKIVISTYSHD